MAFNINAQVRLLPPTNAAQMFASLRTQFQGLTATLSVKIPPSSQRQLNTANKSLTAVAKNAKDGSGAMSDFGKQAALAGKRFFAFTLATTAILKFVGAIKEGISEAISFQRELVKISQVTGNSLTNLKELTKEITRLSTTLGVSSGELLKASRILSQTGLSAKDTQTALEALAKSDVAPTFDDIIKTTEGSIAIFRQFGLEAEELEGVLGSINAVSGKFAVESSDIIAAVRRTGGAFAAAGGSVNDLIGLFTSVRATTRESAESIATGFRTIFTRLQRVRTQNFLGTLGIDLKTVEGQFVGPLEAIRQLSTALKTLPSTDPRFAQIIEELGGFRQVSKVIPLIQQFEIAEKARAVAIAGTNSLTVDAETAQQALAIQIKKTREEFIAMIRAFTDSSTFQGGIKLVLKMAEAFVKVAEALEPLLPLLGTLAIAGIGSVAPRLYKQFSSAGGFGFSGKHEGGFIHKFQTGGLVPGVGNSDTVPASLTPGEFVVRKAAVETIGAGTLQGLNKGGSLQRFAYGGYNRKRKQPELELGLRLDEDSLKSKPLDDIRKEGGITKLGKQQFGVVFAKEKAKATQASGNQPQVSVRNVTDAIGRDKSNRATDSPVGTQVALDGNKNPSSLVKFNVVRGWVSKTAEKYISEGGQVGFESLMQRMSKKLVPDANVLKNVPISNWNTVSGLMFEGIIARLGAPYLSDEKDVDTAASDRQTWDFPRGILGRAGRLFSDRRLKKIPTDAKRSGDDKKIKESLKKKISNTIASKIKGGGEYEGFKLLADGGYGSVNSLLTPGEFVVNKSTASRLGPSTLNSLNHADTLPGFASGGYARGSGNVFRARRLRLDEQGQLTPQAKEYGRRRTERLSKLGGKTARVFDFDDTLATTAAKRFEDFRGDRAKNFISTAKTTGYTMVAKKAADHGQHVFVLTARSSVSKKPIQDFATRAGIPLPASRIITVADDPELNDLREPGAKPNTTRKASTATKKHAILSKLSSLYENIVFYDDNRDNILKAATVPKVKAKHVKVQPYAEGGSVPFSADPSPVRPADEGSRQQYLNFLLNKRLISLFDVKDFNDRFKIPMNKLVDSRVVVEVLKSPNKDAALDFIPRGSELVGSGVEALVFSDKQRAYRLARKGVRGAPIQRPKSTAILQALQTLDFGNVYGEVLPLAQPLDKDKRYNKLFTSNEGQGLRRHAKIKGALLKRMGNEGFDVSEGNVARGELHEGNIGRVGKELKIIDPNMFKRYAEGGSVAGGGHYAVSSDTIGFSPKIVKELLEQIPANIKVNFVIGPAGSGKTTYTQKMGAQPLLDPQEALSARELTFESASQKIANIVPLVNKTQASGGFGILLDPAASVVKSQRDKRVKAKEAGKSFAFDKRSAAALKGTSYAPVSQGKEFVDELKRLFPALQVKKFARGGMVPGVGNRDTVPAMLTPGEAVLSTSTVQQLNKGGIVRSYAGGGLIGGGGGIGNFAAIGFALAGISSLISSFQGLNKTLDAMLNAITSITSQFGLLYFATNSLISGVGKFDKKIAASQVSGKGITRQLKEPRAKEAHYRGIARRVDAIPGPLTQQQSIKAANVKQNVLAKAAVERQSIDTLKEQRREQVKNIKANQSLATQTQYAAIGLGLLVSALNTYAAYLEQKGREDIEQGRGPDAFVQAKTIKGGTTGATIGGIAGGLIGTLGIPGIGTAAGAAIGASVGGGIGAGVGRVSGKGQAKGITLSSEFNKGLEATNRKLAAIGKGTTDFATQRTSLISYINDTRESLFNKELTPEGRKDVVAGFKAQLDGLGSFFRDIATKSTSFEAFIENIGQGTFESFSDLSGIPITELNEQFKQTVKTSIEAREKALKLTKATDEYADQIRRLIGLSRAFNDVTLTMQKLKGTVDTLVAFANGAAGDFRVSDDSARLSKPAEFFDSEKFSAIVARDITNNEALQTTFPGEDASVGAKFGKEVNQAQNIVQQLPAVLLKLRNSVGEFSAEDAVGKLLDEFEGAPPLVLNALRDAANKIIGTEGKEEKLIAEMQKDLLGVAKKLGEGFAPTFETAAKISKAMQTEKNRRLSLVDQLTSLISKEMELRNRSVDIERQREELLAKAGNRPADLNKLQTLDNQKLKNIGAGADPRVIGLRLETAKNKLLQLQIKYDEKRLKSGDKLEEQIKAQKETITRSSAALAHLSDVGARTAVTMQKIDRAQATAQFKQGLLERGASAETPSGVRSMFMELRSARVAQATGSLDDVKPEFRSEVLQLFKNLGPGKLSAFGGESGTEIYQRLLADFAQQMGFNAEDAKKLAAGQSSEIDKLTASLTTIINAAADANKAQVEGLESANAKLLKALDDSINNFGKIVKEMLTAQRAQELEKEIKGQEGVITNKETSAVNLQKFIDQFGGSEKDEKRARLIGQNLQPIKDIDVATERKKTLGTFIDLEKSLTAFDLTREAFLAETGAPRRSDAPVNLLAQGLGETGALKGRYDDRINQDQINARLAKLSGVILKVTGGDTKAVDVFTQDFRKQLELLKTTEDGATEGTITVSQLKNLLPTVLSNTTDTLSKDFDKLADMTSNLNMRLGSELTEEERNRVLGSGTEEERDKHFGELVKEFQTFAKIEQPLIDLKNEIATLNGKLTDKRGELGALDLPEKQRGGLIGFNKGGIVPGFGNRDTVPAMLTPGEVVLPKMQGGGSVKELLEKIEAQKVENRKAEKTRRQGAVVELDKQATTRRTERAGYIDEKYTQPLAEKAGKFSAKFNGIEYTNKEEYLNVVHGSMDQLHKERTTSAFKSVLAGLQKPRDEVRSTTELLTDDERAIMRSRREGKRKDKYERLGRKYKPINDETREARVSQAKRIASGKSQSVHDLTPEQLVRRRRAEAFAKGMTTDEYNLELKEQITTPEHYLDRFTQGIANRAAAGALAPPTSYVMRGAESKPVLDPDVFRLPTASELPGLVQRVMEPVLGTPDETRAMLESLGEHAPGIRTVLENRSSTPIPQTRVPSKVGRDLTQPPPVDPLARPVPQTRVPSKQGKDLSVNPNAVDPYSMLALPGTTLYGGVGQDDAVIELDAKARQKERIKKSIAAQEAYQKQRNQQLDDAIARRAIKSAPGSKVMDFSGPGNLQPFGPDGPKITPMSERFPEIEIPDIEPISYGTGLTDFFNDPNKSINTKIQEGILKGALIPFKIAGAVVSTPYKAFEEETRRMSQEESGFKGVAGGFLHGLGKGAEKELHVVGRATEITFGGTLHAAETVGRLPYGLESASEPFDRFKGILAGNYEEVLDRQVEAGLLDPEDAATLRLIKFSAEVAGGFATGVRATPAIPGAVTTLGRGVRTTGRVAKEIGGELGGTAVQAAGRGAQATAKAAGRGAEFVFASDITTGFTNFAKRTVESIKDTIHRQNLRSRWAKEQADIAAANKAAAAEKAAQFTKDAQSNRAAQFKAAQQQREQAKAARVKAAKEAAENTPEAKQAAQAQEAKAKARQEKRDQKARAKQERQDNKKAAKARRAEVKAAKAKAKREREAATAQAEAARTAQEKAAKYKEKRRAKEAEEQAHADRRAQGQARYDEDFNPNRGRNKTPDEQAQARAQAQGETPPPRQGPGERPHTDAEFKAGRAKADARAQAKKAAARRAAESGAKSTTKTGINPELEAFIKEFRDLNTSHPKFSKYTDAQIEYLFSRNKAAAAAAKTPSGARVNKALEKLGLPPDATKVAIQRKYWDLANKYHPDHIREVLNREGAFGKFKGAFRDMPADLHRAYHTTLTKRLKRAKVSQTNLETIKAILTNANRMQQGGIVHQLNGGALVPGIGSGDKVRALLEPGEFVLNRNAVRAAGPQNLDRFNKQHSRFQKGGPVGMQEGGGVAAMTMPDFTFFNEIIQKFATKVDLLAESLSSINGLEIQLVATHKVEVRFVGAQVLQQLQPSIETLVVGETNKAINGMLKDKFPDVGQMA